MSWLLHMSDPHLGDILPEQELDDGKNEFQQPDLETTQTVFRNTLRKLDQFVSSNGKPSAVVVSGDLTYKARESGFDAFVALVREATDIFPDDLSKVVAVPGNHDVVWAEPPGSEARYAGFLRATRELGLATPLLDGIDFAADDESGKLADPEAAPHLVTGEDLIVIPINSSNWCGTLVDHRGGWKTAEWEAALAPLGDARIDVMTQVDRLRRHDIARVSRPQIEALGRLFAHSGESRSRAPDDHRVRVAVLHHQLLPLSTREERKTFESLVNLGLVRQTLREYDIDLVLHGHKHESGVYWDIVGAPEASLATIARRMLVISSPGHFNINEPVMRALQLTGSPLARSVTISTFLGPSAQRSHTEVADDVPSAPLWLGAMDSESPERTTVRASSAHVAYARLRALYELDPDRPIRNLVCQVDDPGDALTVPPDYPDIGSSQAWFDDLVDWWQLERSELVDNGLVSFNHGGRIYRRWNDQVDRAARALSQQDESSRALIQLVAPRETGRYLRDERDADEGSYPAFVLAQLSITKREGRRHLDCFGYFRKQDLQYWWPVNLAELARIQQAVRDRIGASKRPRIGRIVTFSADARWANSLPQLAVPEIDRLADEPDRLWRLAAAVADSGKDREAVDDWRRILGDLAGEGRPAPSRPKLGIGRLLGDLEHIGRIAPSERIARVQEALRDLHAQHSAHDEDRLNEAAIGLIVDSVARLREVVEAVLAERDEDNVPTEPSPSVGPA